MIDAVHIDRRHELGPVTDQGGLGTCLAHAVTSIHEHKRGLGGLLSPEGLYWYAVGPDWFSGTDGPSIQRALEAPGQPLRSHCSQTPPKAPPSESPHHCHGSDVHALGFDDVEQALTEGRFIVLGMSITDSFRRYLPGPIIATDSSGDVGYHAVVAVGAGEHEGELTVLVRNSWGLGWGDAGHGWIAKSYVDEHLDFTMELTVAA